MCSLVLIFSKFRRSSSCYACKNVRSIHTCGIFNFLRPNLNHLHSSVVYAVLRPIALLSSSSQLLRRTWTETLSFLPCRTATLVKMTVTLSTCPPAAEEAGLPPNAAAGETSPKNQFRFWETGCTSIASTLTRQSRRNWVCLDRRISLCHRWGITAALNIKPKFEQNVFYLPSCFKAVWYFPCSYNETEVFKIKRQNYHGSIHGI